MKFIGIFVIGFFGLFIVALIISRRGDAKLRKSGVLPSEGKATMADVERLIQSGQKILAIRCYREIHRVGLAEAKNAVEELAREIKSRNQP